MNGVALVTKPVETGSCPASLIDRAWSTSPRVSTRGGTILSSLFIPSEIYSAVLF